MFYVLDENNNKVEALDKEGVLNAIEEAIANGSLANLVADAAFITKLKCCVTGGTNKIGFITQAKYNEMEKNGLIEVNTAYFITDDATLGDIETQINALLTEDTNINNRLASLEERINKLGFKEGTFSYTGGGAITENSLKKQGKYVIANFNVVNGANTGILSLSQDFRPKAVTKIIGQALNEYGIAVGFVSYLKYDGILYSDENCTTKWQWGNFTIANAGWETY